MYYISSTKHHNHNSEYLFFRSREKFEEVLNLLKHRDVVPVETEQGTLILQRELLQQGSTGHCNGFVSLLTRVYIKKCPKITASLIAIFIFNILVKLYHMINTSVHLLPAMSEQVFFNTIKMFNSIIVDSSILLIVLFAIIECLVVKDAVQESNTLLYICPESRTPIFPLVGFILLIILQYILFFEF